MKHESLIKLISFGKISFFFCFFFFKKWDGEARLKLMAWLRTIAVKKLHMYMPFLEHQLYYILAQNLLCVGAPNLIYLHQFMYIITPWNRQLHLSM